MSSTHQAIAHPESHGEPGGHAHPGAGTYLKIAVVLTAITVLEVWVYTVEALKAVLAPMLLILSATKFALVVGFYMHLKFDNRLFSYIFGFGLFVGGSIITALLLLFSQHPLPPNNPLYNPPIHNPPITH